jgi:hypothetical protein
MCFASSSADENRAHERAHLPQVRALGPFYLPAHIVLQGASAAQFAVAPDSVNDRWHQQPINILETGPMQALPRPWPWL